VSQADSRWELPRIGGAYIVFVRAIPKARRHAAERGHISGGDALRAGSRLSALVTSLACSGGYGVQRKTAGP
jgi:hypothetical protein